MLYGHDFDDDGNEIWQLVTQNASEEMSIDDLKEAMKASDKEIVIRINEVVGGASEVRIMAVPKQIKTDDLEIIGE